MKSNARRNNQSIKSPAKWMSISLLSGLLAGCVSGPSAYLKTVSEETALAGSEQIQTRSAEIQPVQTAELAPPAPSISGLEPATDTQIQPQIAAPANGSADIGENAPIRLLSPAQAAAQGTLETAYSPTYQPLYPTGQPLNSTGLAAPALGNIEPAGSFAIGLPSEPIIDPQEAAAEARIPVLYSSIQHGQCKSGRGPKPRKISATNINPGDPYYIEIRMRHTPLLPVGHTYIAYGRLGAGGQILDEKLIMLAPVGGYAGAALASGIPMPGILNPHPDDCRIRPKTAYRVSLNAQRYEKLLLEVQQARKERPSYLLFTYNCNHFMTRMAKSVGIRPPKNIYVPALEYIYAMIEENEGRKISRR